ncbi:single-stranded-DNA-specific exonuclease RecJ [Bacillus alkalicellulosilyticus]|uniref:single-stranded-DNA-specific exonuclease RecJ n=1 Tax=Alkalihalobacterium alkalicellulosilyticum TaxID=1912214 RepID=UPI0009982247|nr:single-stranded-DNA-specific exonuclease RecJ [Bacillus alkalicellulosilyticus]
MLKPKSRWKLESVDDVLVAELVKELQVAPLVAKLLVTRGFNTVESARHFLNTDQAEFHNPFLMDGMQETVTRIKEAVEKEERILVFGDYDADGVSSTTVMIYTLRELGAQFDYYIPNRFTEGYGPNEPAFRKAKEEGYDLIVTVDTGISAVHEAEVAKELELDFIITDHHEPPPVLPDAYAIVNPKKPGCTYPFKGLAGVGVAFKLAQALLERTPTELLDIVVIGTIADLVPLVDENRLLAKKGIEAFHYSKKPGIQALKKVCGIDEQPITAEHIGFGIGPRINAAGRLESADPAVELLIADNYEDALQIAERIDLLNKDRQAIVNEMTEEAIAMVESEFPPSDNQVLIVGKEGWNAGVIGIVASRLVERFYRATIVLSINEEKGEAKGSARSIEGFDMFENLSMSRDILPHFGGHPMAAGLTIKLEYVETLRDRLNKQAKETMTAEDFIPSTKVDLRTSLSEVTLGVIEQMERLAPYGVSNPTPKIMIEDVGLEQIRKIGSEKNHLKMMFEHEGSKLDAIGFHLGHLHDEMTSYARVSAIGTLSINEWNGHCKPQLMLDDIAVSDWQLFDWRDRKQIEARILSLPKEKRTLVAFRETTVDQLSLHSFTEEVKLVSTEQNVQLEGKYLVLLDLPYETKELEMLFNQEQCPERVYTVFHQEESHYFETNPTREHFKWYYAFLKQRGSFEISKFGEQLAKHKGWSKSTIDWMTNVFFELGFVTINNGIITLHSNPSKKDLVDSISYRRRQAQATIENQFVYSSYVQLKLWFDGIMKNESKLKETVK